MNTRPRCSTEEVAEFLRVRREYRRRKEHIAQKLLAITRQMESVDNGIHRLDFAFRETAAPSKGPVYEGVFPDGTGGFVNVKAIRGHNSMRPSLSVEPVLDCSN